VGSNPTIGSRIMSRSRIRQNIEEKSRKHLFLLLIGVILFVVGLFTFGLPMLIQLSLLFQKSDTNEQISREEQASVLLPPILDIQTEATNKDKITISGTAAKDHRVMIYVNNTLVAEEELTQSDSFTINNVRMKKGENAIYAKVRNKAKKESEPSEVSIVRYLPDPPTLTVDYPTDGLSIGGDYNPMRVRGTTDPKVTVTVNGFRAIVDAAGKFTYNLQLQGGENKITFVATDDAGNKTEKEVKVILQ
jgi:hypothetical protein